MGLEFNQVNCSYCNKMKLVVRSSANPVFHLLLIIITGGIWLVLYVIFKGNEKSKKYRCVSCGTIYEIPILSPADTNAANTAKIDTVNTNTVNPVNGK